MPLRISSVQTYTLHDGPGIRTTLFLSGCPLRCSWCHNPETQSTVPIPVFDRARCIGCGLCAVCPNGAHSFENGHAIDRRKCTGCGKCVAACPAKALSLSSRDMTDEEFREIVARQKRVMGDIGGITFSGGEPLLQGEEVIRLVKGLGVHTAIETCGHAAEELFRGVIESVDYVMFDIKLADSDRHRRYTGVGNETILRNLEILRQSGKPFLLRTPMIPGITDTEENLNAVRGIVGDDPWEKLPFNPLTGAKYERIGLEYGAER